MEPIEAWLVEWTTPEGFQYRGLHLSKEAAQPLVEALLEKKWQVEVTPLIKKRGRTVEQIADELVTHLKSCFVTPEDVELGVDEQYVEDVSRRQLIAALTEARGL